MSLSRVLNTLLLPGVIWLLLGAPSLLISGNAILFAFVIAHLLVVIWNDAIFALFRGDSFTYGMYSMSVNIISFAITFLVAFLVLLFSDGLLGSAKDIPAIAWGLMVLGVLGTVFLPLLVSHNVAPLPRPADAREYHDPVKDQLPR
jgi:hypothetical protein